MENRMMKAVKNMAIGAAVGAVATMAGAVYVSDNRQAQQAVRSVKCTGKKNCPCRPGYDGRYDG